MFDQKVYQVALSLVPGIGNMLARQLISYCGSAENIFQEKHHKLLKIPGIGTKTVQHLHRQTHFTDAISIIERCSREGARILHYTDPEYPNRLKSLYDAPQVLYYKGKGDLNALKSVGIVGTRNATTYGKSMVDKIIEGLIPHNPLIISGLAYGIDFHAHYMALNHNIPTIGVIGGGFRHIYPAIHQKAAMKMLPAGGLLSEYEPDIKPEAHHFPDRNRIIAGLSDVLMVIEAAKKGGALITAEFANNYNREVFAVPGNIGQKYSEGCNHYIKQHKAHIFTNVGDIEYIMNWELGNNGIKREFSIPDDLNPTERKIMEAFNHDLREIQIDELSWKSQVPLNQLAGNLLNLEFRGYIKMLPGKRIKSTV